jgi:hypothetical protein
MATFYYKTPGEGDTSYQITFGNNVIDLDPITDGENDYKVMVTNADQGELDAFEAAISAAEGVTIITETEYNTLT